MYLQLKKWLNQYFGNEQVLLLLGLLIGLSIFFNLLGRLLSPFILSFVLAFLLQSVVRKLELIKVRRNIAVIIALLVLVGILLLLCFYLLPTVWQQLTSLVHNWSSIAINMQTMIQSLEQHFPDYITADVANKFALYLQSELLQIGEVLIAYVLAQLPDIIMVLIYVILVPVLTYFIMSDWPAIVSKTQGWVHSKGGMLQSVFNEMDIQIANYIRGKAIEIIIVAVVSYIVFSAFGLHYALLLAMVVGLSVLVPYVGAFSVTIPVAMVAFLQWGWSLNTLYLLIAYLTIQILDGNLLVPIVFSEAVSLSPLIIILAVIIFGGLWGFWGVFFAIPLASLTNAIIKSWAVETART